MSLVTKENVPTPHPGRTVHPIKMTPPRPLADADAKTDGVRTKRRTIDMLKHGSVNQKALPYSAASKSTRASREVEEAEESDGSEVINVEEDGGSSSGDEESESDDESNSNLQDVAAEKGPGRETKETATSKLKELFAPREENAGFFLLGHLDLDLELDEDAPFPTTAEQVQPPITEISPITIPASASGQSKSTRATTSIQFDPKKPLFFPLPSSSSLGPPNKGRQKDLFDVAKEKGWNWRDPSVGFYRTETEDEIRNRWEESKGELTREWKRRWKEAGKINRRKYGGVREDVE